MRSPKRVMAPGVRAASSGSSHGDLTYLCVSLSTTEACPMVFNEARVLNVPIVTTDFGSAHEFVTDGVDGYIRPIEKIPDVISDICLDLGKYQNLHKNSVPKYIVNNEIKLKLISILN